MKAGLTVLVAIASASVNAHVKVETVNFDEDLLNSEKNIAGTFAWKEKASGRRQRSTARSLPGATLPAPRQEGGDRPDIVVTFKFEVRNTEFEGSYDEDDEDEATTYYTPTGDLTIDAEEYSDVTLVFEHRDSPSNIHNGLLVQIQNDDETSMEDDAKYETWMEDDAKYEKNGEVSEHTFQDMEKNYQTMQKLYDERRNKNEETKQTKEEMKWTISDKLDDYDDMVKKTAVVKKELEPKKKHSEASTEEEKTQESDS